MEWFEIAIHTNNDGEEIISEMLINNGATGTSILNKSYIPDINKPGNHWELYDQSLIDNMPDDVEVHAWFNMDENLYDIISNIKSDIKKLMQYEKYGSLKIEELNVDDNDWKDIWKKYFKPIKIGKNIVVKPSWEEYKNQNDDIIIELDPGMAFGTGTHATTYMCIELLEKYIDKNKSVIDIGTGSGILSIVAAKLNAKNILGIDISEDAVIVAKENIEKNNLANTVEIIQGDLINKVEKKYDIAVANIIADAILLLNKDVVNILNPKGKYIMSGILSDRADEIYNSTSKLGFKLIDKLEKDEWVAMAFEKEE